RRRSGEEDGETFPTQAGSASATPGKRGTDTSERSRLYRCGRLRGEEGVSCKPRTSRHYRGAVSFNNVFGDGLTATQASHQFAIEQAFYTALEISAEARAYLLHWHTGGFPGLY